MLYGTDITGTSRDKDEGEVFRTISKQALLQGRVRDKRPRNKVCRDF